MSWKSPFVIYRVSSSGALEPVFVCEDIKKAKYWLNYIAQPGDVLCRTPAHPKHTQGTACPEYWCHKEQTGTSSSEQSRWKTFVEKKVGDVSFPEEETPVAN